MISIQTLLSVKDNTGIKKVQCIKIFKGLTASIGDIILISVKKLKFFNTQKKIKIKKGNILKAIIIQTKYPCKNTIGNYIRFDQNCVLLLNNQGNLIGNRIFSPITTHFRKKKNVKILTLASRVL